MRLRIVVIAIATTFCASGWAWPWEPSDMQVRRTVTADLSREGRRDRDCASFYFLGGDSFACCQATELSKVLVLKRAKKAVNGFITMKLEVAGIFICGGGPSP